MKPMKPIMKPILMIAASAFVMATFGSPNVASADGKVVYYSAGGAKLSRALVKAFKKKHPDIKIDSINAGTGEIITRMRAERKNPRGDVFRASVEAIETAKDLFEPYKTKEHDKFPKDVVGKGQLHYGFSTAIQLLIVNTKLLPGGKAPKCWKDLAKPEYKGKITMSHPALSGSGARQLTQMVQLFGWGFVKKLIGNAVIVPKSRLVYKNVSRGEQAIGLTEESKPYRMAKKGFPVKAVYPCEGVGMSYGSVAIIKGGPNPKNARIFADFHNSFKVHKLGVKVLKRRSARPDVKRPKGFKKVSDIKFFHYDMDNVRKNRKAYIKKFEKLMDQI